MKYTPENITKLEPNDIFVYGSNQYAQHNGGAAWIALNFGATWQTIKRRCSMIWNDLMRPSLNQSLVLKCCHINQPYKCATQQKPNY